MLGSKKWKKIWYGSLLYDLWRLLGFVQLRQKRKLGFLLVLMVVSSFSEVVSLGAVLPFLESLGNADALLEAKGLQPVLSAFQIETSTQLVTALATFFMVSVITCNGLRILTINVQTRLSASIASDISCQLYQRVMLQPYGFHIQQNSSDLLQLLTGDTRGLTSAILTPFLMLITSGCTVIALTVGLFLVNWLVALIASVLLGGAYLLLYKWRRRVLEKNSQIVVQTSQQQIKIAQEGLGGIRDVLIGNTQDFFQLAYRRADVPLRQTLASNTVIALTPRYVIEALAMSAIALLALMLGKGDDFSKVVPVLGGLALGASRLLPALQRVFSVLVRIQSARASLQRILQGLQRPLSYARITVPSKSLPLKKVLRFEHVSFRYSTHSDWVLKELSISIFANTTVGFVGTTGSGKSTAADIILGLLSPQEGVISVDGIPLEGEQLRQWQKNIAHVPQSIFLSDATITENIAFGIPAREIDIERVRYAAQLAQIDEYIRTLPAQYETYVGERGVRLSGGQRQRIGIARALYTQASVIVFDEATSALDNETEREVMSAIDSLSHQFTIIMIAHRLSTLEKCDQIIEFTDGQAISCESYQALINRSNRSPLDQLSADNIQPIHATPYS